MAGKKFEICENPEFGRYLAAETNINAGESIYIEKLALVGPSWGSPPCCLNCYRKSSELCKNCGMAPLCKSCDTHDNGECELYRDSKWEQNFVVKNFDIVTPVRVLLLSRSDGALYDEIMQMGARLRMRKDTKVWKLHEKYIIEPLLGSNLKQILTNISLDHDLLQKLCAILDMITFEVRGARDVTLDSGNDPSFKLRGIYKHSALLVQSCIANSFLTIDAEFNIKLYAGQNIKKGETITYNNAIVMLGTKERREQLQKIKHILCKCRRCLDPSELGTYMSSVKCTICKNGLLILCGHCAKGWTCEHCDANFESDKVENLMEEAQQALMDGQSDASVIQDWLTKYSEQLSSKHWLMLDAKQVLTGLLKSQCAEGKSTSLKVFNRKLTLFEEIVESIRVLRPGLSRMLGIVLYDYQLSMVQVAKKNFDAGDIKVNEYLETLSKVEVLLKESINNLVFEHKTTPEGQLCKRALLNLKDLRILIAELKDASTEKKVVIGRKNKKKNK